MPKYDNTLPKLDDGEMFFLIRGHDIHAPAIVRSYASMLACNGDNAGAKEVFAIADAMVKWQHEHPNKVKKPD